MYEQVSHSLLNEILTALNPDIKKQDLRHFYTRLGANFYAIYTLLHRLYGRREDFEAVALRLVETLARQYIARSTKLKKIDVAREKDYTWFLSQEWVGMALYSDGFAGNLKGLQSKIAYLQELGINLLHILPLLRCPEGASDGGYAVSHFRELDPRAGTLQDLHLLTQNLRKGGILLALDVVLNHTSNEHEWALKARAGDPLYQAYYHVFENREIPDLYEETMPEIFPETAPGNFTYDEQMHQWVMTVFNPYQWDLNYHNPAVFIEMLDIVLFWANQGVDIVRLDAVAFLWKKIGTACQNEHEAHLVLQLMKDCCQVTAPGVLFIAEAIVAPVEVAKYFGEDAVIAKECEIAYNATYMALLWDAVATKNTRLLNQGIQNLPGKLDRATWLNYLRCHDDIGLGFDDRDIQSAGYDPKAHRRFLIDYFTGAFAGSFARGMKFGSNDKTGDARISGSLASLTGLEASLEQGDATAIEQSIQLIVLLHSMILSFGGIPLLYYGDEIGTTNNYRYREETSKANDSRWMHRPLIDWKKAAKRTQRGTIEQQLFSALRKMIAVRKSIPAFADYNNRELLDTENPHLFVFLRTDPKQPSSTVMVVGNFDSAPQVLELEALGRRNPFRYKTMKDLFSGESASVVNGGLLLKPYQFCWLAGQ